MKPHDLINAWCGKKRGNASFLARGCGVGKPYICQIRAGYRGLPTLEMAIKFEVVTNGELRADELRPDDAALINYLRTTGA